MPSGSATIPTRTVRHIRLPAKIAHLTAAAIEVATAAVLAPTAPITVPAAIYAERLSACTNCPHHLPDGNLGLGECAHPGCGCTKAKLVFATLSCPMTPPKWNKWSATP